LTIYKQKVRKGSLIDMQGKMGRLTKFDRAFECAKTVTTLSFVADAVVKMRWMKAVYVSGRSVIQRRRRS